MIVDIHTLKDILSDKSGLLDRTWQRLPHFFIGTGKNAKSVRFDVDDVMFALKSGGGQYECVEGQDNGEMAVQVSVSGKQVRSERVPGKTIRSGSRNKRQKRSAEPPEQAEILSLFKRSSG